MCKEKSERVICKTNEEFWNEVSKVWDYEKNEKHWREYTRGSHSYIWVKCDKIDYHKSYKIKCYDFSKGNRCSYCNSNSGKVHPLDSFAQYHIINTDEDFLLKYWNYEKNTVDPWTISPSSNKNYVWIICQEKKYHGSYLVNCSDFTVGENRCPYCSSRKTHPLDSFAQWGIDNLGEDFLEKYWSDKNTVDPWTIATSSSKNKIWIKCQLKDYHGSYDILCSDFTRGKRCPYCNSNSGKIHILDSLGELYPQVLNIWSCKNIKSPYGYTPMTHKEIWWKCLDGKHEDYYRGIATSNRFEFRCPECTREKDESLLQEKVRLYLNELGYGTLHEHNCSIVPRNPKNNHMLPFDNEVVELKLIIEVHGEQHYEINYWHKLSAKKHNTIPQQELEYQQWRDEHKKQYALASGYYYLAIPHWTNDKKESYKQLINNKIKSIKNQL